MWRECRYAFRELIQEGLWGGWGTDVKDDFQVIGIGDCGAGGPISGRDAMR